MTVVMTETKETLGKGHIIETKDSTFHSEADPEVTIIQEGQKEDTTNIEIDVKVVNKFQKSIQIIS